jgi:hypothetical protein
MRTTVARVVRSRLVALVTVAALGTGALVASLAIAHNVVYPSQVVVKKASPAGLYRGRVLSAKVPCKVNREVQVYHANPNPDVRLGTVFTNGAGRWTLAGPALPNGHKVYALIETKVLNPPNPPGHNHTCSLDRSPKRAIPYP